MSKLKKAAAALLVLALAIGCMETGGMAKVSAKAKSYTAYISVFGSNYSVGNAETANAKIKNKKGKKKYTLTLNRNDSFQQPQEGEKIALDSFDVYIDGILNDRSEKDVKITNVVIKSDGKKVKINPKNIEYYAQTGEDEETRYCINIFDGYGKKNAVKAVDGKTEAFDFKDKLTVSFNINIKK